MRISIILDLLAGLLIGADLLIPAHYLTVTDSRLQKPLHKIIRGLLSDDRKGNIKHLLIILILFLLFFVTPFFAVEIYKDVHSASFTSGQLLTHYGLLALGLIIGVVLCNYAYIFLSNRTRNTGRHSSRSGKRFASQAFDWWAVSILISVLAIAILVLILLFTDLAIPMVPIMIGIAVGGPYALVLIMFVAFISSRKGIIARIGIILFIASKIIELAYFG